LNWLECKSGIKSLGATNLRELTAKKMRACKNKDRALESKYGQNTNRGERYNGQETISIAGQLRQEKQPGKKEATFPESKR
jgi:hypothetical protein